MNQKEIRSAVVIILLIFAVSAARGQTKLPEELTTGTVREQIDYVEKHTRIYDNFRAIREDIFQKLNKNAFDSLTAEKNRVAELKNHRAVLNSRTDSLNLLLSSTRRDLDEVTATKNKISVLGLELNKSTYNSILWTIIGLLLFIGAIGFLVFRRNLVVLLRTEKDLRELKEEFAAYKKTSRIAREKVEMDLFRANQKLKGMV